MNWREIERRRSIPRPPRPTWRARPSRSARSARRRATRQNRAWPPRSCPGHFRPPGCATRRPAFAPMFESASWERKRAPRCWDFPPSILSGSRGVEQAVDIVLRQGWTGLLGDLDRAIAFAATDAVGIAFDLEAAVRSEISLGVDELARIEGHPGQTIIEVGGRQRFGHHHIGAGVATGLDGRLAGVAGHDQDRHGAIFVVGITADGARERETAMRRQPAIAQEDVDL